MRIPRSDAGPPAIEPPRLEPTPSIKAPQPAEPGASSAFAKVLHKLGGEIDRGEHVVDAAAHGRANVHDPASLLALQAGVYRYVEAIDLASKLIDRATTAVKTVLQNQ